MPTQRGLCAQVIVLCSSDVLRRRLSVRSECGEGIRAPAQRQRPLTDEAKRTIREMTNWCQRIPLPTVGLWLGLLVLIGIIMALGYAPEIRAAEMYAPTIGAGRAAAGTRADAALVAVPEPSPETLDDYRSGNVLWLIATLWGLLVPAAILFSGFSARLLDLGVGRRQKLVLHHRRLRTVVCGPDLSARSAAQRLSGLSCYSFLSCRTIEGAEP